MDLTQNPLWQSQDWYDFVSKTAAYDSEVRQYVQEYAQAHTKLTDRIKALASQHNVSTVEGRDGADAVASPGLLSIISDYHAAHGVEISKEDLAAQASNDGIVLGSS